MKPVVVVVFLALAAFVAAADVGAYSSEDYTELEPSVKHSAVFRPGHPLTYLVRPASSTFNVRVYRHDKFGDATTQLLFCYQRGAVPACNKTSQTSTYDVTIIGATVGATYYFVVNQVGKSQSFDFDIKHCSGRCYTECVFDCSGHGGCDDDKECDCDDGYVGTYCYRTESDEEAWERTLKYIIIGVCVGAFFLVILPIILVVLCCCGVICVGLCPRRTRYQPINATAPPTVIYTQPYQQPPPPQPYYTAQAPPPTPVSYVAPPTTPTAPRN